MAERAQAETGRQDAAGDAPERTCVVTRAHREREDLVRFVRAPDGQIIADVACRLPGRGVWVTCARDAVTLAVKANAFARSYRKPVSLAPSLADDVERLLTRRVTEALALANKAGLVVCGFAKIEAEIASGGVVALLHGSDAAADGRRKLDQRLHAAHRDKQSHAPHLAAPEIIDLLTIDELSLVMGRANVVHAALKAGGASTRLLREATRLGRYRTGLRSYDGKPEQLAAPCMAPQPVVAVAASGPSDDHSADAGPLTSGSNTDRA